MPPDDLQAALFGYAIAPPEVALGGAGGSTSTLAITVSNETGEDQVCNWIRFTLPPELRGGSIELSTSTSTWSLSRDTDDGAYLAAPQGATSGLGAGEAVKFDFTGVDPATVPGAATIAVLEDSDQLRQATIDVTLIADGIAITKFTVDHVYVAPDATVEFSWDTSGGADQVVLEWDDGSHQGGPSGSCEVQPKASITATLTAIKTGSESRKAQLMVTVARPEVLSFGAVPDPTYVTMGHTVTLSWVAIRADHYKLAFYPSAGVAAGAAAGAAAGDEFEVPARSDGWPVKATESGVWHLEAVAVGLTDSKSRPVTVKSVVIETFGVQPGTIAPGRSATLTWGAEWASAVTIAPELGTVGLSGSTLVSPPSDTTYALSASGKDPQTAHAPLAVYPALLELAVTILPFAHFELAWSSSGEKATLSGVEAPPTGRAQLTGGSYTLTIASALGASVTVALTAAPPQVSPYVQGQVAIGFRCPGGANLAPATPTLTWRDTLRHMKRWLPTWEHDSLSGQATTAAGASVPIGPALTGDASVDVQRPPREVGDEGERGRVPTALWQVHADGDAWALGFSIGLNKPAPR